MKLTNVSSRPLMMVFLILVINSAFADHHGARPVDAQEFNQWMQEISN